ncbi:MAG: isoaspartyl peptidase/L-asparaginase [candidate division WOR-3 bacterium]
MNGPLALICQGGAGVLPDPAASAAGLAEALEKGYRLLRQSADALDVVVETVRIMEDNPVFNAGTGSSLNLEGVAEMDAGVMTQDGRFGGVCAVTGVRNPILLAHKVMTETDHLLLCGRGAEAFARQMGFPEYDVVTERARERLAKFKEEGVSDYFPRLAARLRAKAEERGGGSVSETHKMGTVGAVAYDKHGVLAAATSSGGIVGRLPGRVGDSAIPGAGVYAGPSGAVSCTGHGEAIVRIGLGRDIVERMKTIPAATAAILVIAEAKRRKIMCGLVGIDARGQVCFGHTTPDMAWGYVVADKLFMFTDSDRKRR